MDTGDLYTFNCNAWLGKTQGNGVYSKDLAATVRGKAQIKSRSKSVLSLPHKNYNKRIYMVLFHLEYHYLYSHNI